MIETAQPDALTPTGNAGVSHTHHMPQPQTAAAHATRQEGAKEEADSSHTCFQQSSMEVVPEPATASTLPTKVIMHT